MSIDLSLYLIVEGVSQQPSRYLPIVRLALKNGVTAVQLRQKHSSLLQKYSMALYLRQITNEFGVPLIINDHVDIAMAVNADGVHVGQQDLPCQCVRSLLGKSKVIGCSVSSQKDIALTHVDSVDYLGVGPIYSTETKKNAAPEIGMNGLKQTRALSLKKPLVAIGGIDVTNIAAIRALGVGVAVSSAICQAQDPAKASRLLC
ncbi:MAG: thiamine phosphate synthase [Gammaproteobacteria bacterium]|nr:thiamine phosphate synthase [Gammaproteobacteria bacterium]MCH9743418.1 thiamine phosphate synthase [Gammaproteobacteria bacterium]